MRTSLIAVLATLLMLTACGQTGPLYLPKESPSAQTENENGEEGSGEETDQQQVEGATE